MRFSFVLVVGLTMVAAALVGSGASQDAAKGAKKAPKTKTAAKGELAKLDPWGRPEGSIVDQTARYYVWYDGDAWHLRTTAKGFRNFHGTIRVKDARIKSSVPVGLKKDKQKKAATDGMRISDDRSKLEFNFRTAQFSDGFELRLDTEGGEIEFELMIDNQKNPRAIFVGRGLEHPDSDPFTLPAVPQKAK
jgi:hypothetical protein